MSGKVTKAWLQMKISSKISRAQWFRQEALCMANGVLDDIRFHPEAREAIGRAEELEREAAAFALAIQQLRSTQLLRETEHG